MVFPKMDLKKPFMIIGSLALAFIISSIWSHMLNRSFDPQIRLPISPAPKAVSFPLPDPPLLNVQSKTPPQMIKKRDILLKTPLKKKGPKKPFISSPNLLDQAIEAFLHGKETLALTYVIEAYEKDPLSKEGVKAAQLAKQIRRIRSTRDFLLKSQKQDKKSWIDLMETEKNWFNRVGSITLKKGAWVMAKKGDLAFEQKDFNFAKQFWELSLTWNPLEKLSLSGISRLENEGEKNLQRAYLLENIDPDRSQNILKETLAFLPKNLPLTEKIGEILKEKKNHSKPEVTY